MKPLEPLKEDSAYCRLRVDETAFVDAWIATGQIKKALQAAGLNNNYTTTAWVWMRKPQIQVAIAERIEALRGVVPDLIADQIEVLQALTYMARESEDENIRLKAWQALERHYNPSKFTSNNYNFNLKETLDAAEQLEREGIQVRKGPHR